MTVLVDPAGWPRHGRLWCHLVSDESYAELHAFASAVRIPSTAFHRDHYDVPADFRDEVVRAGAVCVTSRELVHRLVSAGLRRRQPRSRRGSPGEGTQGP